MFVEYSTTERFADPRRVRGPAALESTDFTSRVVLTDLPPGQRIFYRVLFQDLVRPPHLERSGGRQLHDAVRRRRATSRIAWSADTVGQGWGINPEWGGLRLYETMRRAQPDVFIHGGDTIYADQPLAPEVKLDDGTHLEERRDRGQVEGRGDARRLSRQLPVQPASTSTCAASTPRSRRS